MAVRSRTQKTAWREALATAIRTPDELAAILGLEPAVVTGSDSANRAFRLLVPRSFVARMQRSTPTDPLLRQVLPVSTELAPQPPDYTVDPLDEEAATRSPGLLVKYAGRALLVTSGACAVHCRYCFRRHFPYATHNPRRAHWEQAIAAIADDASVNEVILSGGDPLMLDDTELAQLTGRLDRIAHLRSLRIHTRLPIVLPERVDDSLLAWLGSSRLPVTLVLHANHPAEITHEIITACQRLRPHVRFLLNQAVLLAGVNDDADTLVALSRALFDAGILPYYLHLPDRVAGTAHFAVDERTAQSLISTLRKRLPGYLVPRLAREEPGAPGKRVLA